MTYSLAFLCSPYYTAFLDLIKEKLSVYPEVEIYVFTSYEEMTSSEVWGRIDIFVPLLRSSQECDSVLQHNPIKWFHSASAGVDAYMTSVMLNSSVPLTNAKGAFDQALTEYTIATMLYFNKCIPQLNKQKDAKHYHRFFMQSIYDKTLCVLGYGSIGRSVAKACKAAFGMKVIGIRRSGVLTDEYADEMYRPHDLMSVLPSADFLVMALPAHPETNNLIGEEQISHMKSSAVIINVGRGSTLDEDALADALKEHRLLGAALDVFKTEPIPSDSKLWECPRLLISPHNADMTEDYIDAAFRVLKDNLMCFLKGEPLLTVVDKQKGY